MIHPLEVERSFLEKIRESPFGSVSQACSQAMQWDLKCLFRYSFLGTGMLLHCLPAMHCTGTPKISVFLHFKSDTAYYFPLSSAGGRGRRRRPRCTVGKFLREKALTHLLAFPPSADAVRPPD